MHILNKLVTMSIGLQDPGGSAVLRVCLGSMRAMSEILEAERGQYSGFKVECPAKLVRHLSRDSIAVSKTPTAH